MARAEATDVIVATPLGRVRGRRSGTGRSFRGIPYAAAPTGADRFGAPRPHPGWTGIRDCREPGPTAPQPPRNRLGGLDLTSFFATGWVVGADYLTVDVWAPAASPAEPAPVMVFVHAGGFVAGSTHGSAYDGSAFARDGVIFVSVQYRLGAAGFLSLPDAPDNRAQLDVAAALRWVQHNIAAFGGDPDRVTLAGQSAGAILVAGMLSTADAGGLFARAIIQSGSGTAALTHEQAGRVTAEIGRILDLDPTRESLADIPDQVLVDTIAELTRLDLRTPTARPPLNGLTPYGPVLARQPAASAALGGGRDVQLLMGTNADEAGLYLDPSVPVTRDDLLVTAARLHDDPRALLAAYRQAAPESTPGERKRALLTDAMFGRGTRELALARAAAAAPTHVYEFTWRSDALGGALGSSHLMELPFAFDATAAHGLSGPGRLLGQSDPPAGLASRMHAAWVSFVSSGDPGWPQFDATAPVVQQIGDEWSLTLGAHARLDAVWAGRRQDG